MPPFPLPPHALAGSLLNVSWSFLACKLLRYKAALAQKDPCAVPSWDSAKEKWGSWGPGPFAPAACQQGGRLPAAAGVAAALTLLLLSLHGLSAARVWPKRLCCSWVFLWINSIFKASSPKKVRLNELGEATLSHHFSQGRKRLCSSRLAFFKGSWRLSGSLLNPPCNIYLHRSVLAVVAFSYSGAVFLLGFFLFHPHVSCAPASACQGELSDPSCSCRASSPPAPVSPNALLGTSRTSASRAPGSPALPFLLGSSSSHVLFPAFLLGFGNTCFLQHCISAYNCGGFGGGSSERPAYSYDIKCRYWF